MSYGWETHDIHRAGSTYTPSYALVHNYLLRHELTDPASGKFELVGELAESFEYLDPMTIVFKLRKGVKFHDGSDLNAEVVKWNIERLRSHEFSRRRSLLATIESVDTPDDYTVIVRQDSPNGALASYFSGGFYGWPGIISKKAVEDLGDDAYGLSPVSTGPFRFKEYIADDRVILERFEDYWETGEDGDSLPYLDQVVVRYVPDLTVGVAELAAGTTHAAQAVPPSQFAAVSAVDHLAWDTWSWATTTYFAGLMKSTKSPFDDVRVRKAINYAIDREGMAKVIGADTVPAGIPMGIGPAVLGWSEEAEHYYDYDPDKAKALLKEAGYADGFDTTLKSISREPDNTIAQYAIATWEEVGIRAKYEPMEKALWVANVKEWQDDWDLAIARYPAIVDPAAFWSNWSCGAGWNCNHVCDEKLDALMMKGQEETDPAVRDEIYRELYLHIQEQAYWFCGCRTPFNLVRNRKLKGVAANLVVPDLRAAWISSA
jgi:peptide/nickel transport system substrate-binding protein